jgi:hypothetical protein
VTRGYQPFTEVTGSRSANIQRVGRKERSTVDVKYMALGYADDAAVHAAANRFFSENRMYNVNGYDLLVNNYEIENLGCEAWQVVAHYESMGFTDDERDEPLKRARQFDTSGSTRHMTQAYEETRFGTNAPDMKKAIEVDGDSVKGVDVVQPALQWTETYDVPDAVISAEYIRQVAGLTGCVNNARFRTFAAGEVLFMGCNGSQQWDDEKGSGPWSLSFKFVASVNAGAGQALPALTIGDITGIAKKGHEYLWVKYESDASGTSLLKKPKHVYVNQVYRPANFNLLGLGGE